jgi:hypothetical protein
MARTHSVYSNKSPFFCVNESNSDVKLTTALQTVKVTLLNNALTKNPSVHHCYKRTQHSSNVVHNIVSRLIREITSSITWLSRVLIKIISLQLFKNNWALFWNLKFHLHAHNRPRLLPSPKHINQVCILLAYLFNINFSIIHPSSLMSSK